MRKVLCCVAVLCMFALTRSAHSQAQRKPGLYDVTTTMTWQKSPLPPNMPSTPPNSPFSGAPRHSQVCVTQAAIDKWGGPAPQTRGGDCQPSGINKTAARLTATISCTGQMSGTGTVEVSWTGDGSGTSKIHFTGTMTAGPRSVPIEWTMNSSSTYKGADCGDVKPIGN